METRDEESRNHTARTCPEPPSGVNGKVGTRVRNVTDVSPRTVGAIGGRQFGPPGSLVDPEGLFVTGKPAARDR